MIVLAIALTLPTVWPIAFDRSWRAVVRINITPSPVSIPYDSQGASALYSGEFFERLLTSEGFLNDLKLASKDFTDDFHYLGMKQYRSTRRFDLKFSGPSEPEVRHLSELAVKLLIPLALTNSHIAELKLEDVKTVSSSQDRQDLFFRGRSMTSEDW